jgi:quercetin dioxygenase-like cupin family protein
MNIERRRIEERPAMVVAHHGPIHRIRKIFETRDVGMFHSTIAAGAQLPREVHKFIEIIYRLKGSTVTMVDGQEFITRPGGYLIVPAGRWHQTLPLEPAEVVEQIILATYNQVPGSLFAMMEAMLDAGAAEPPQEQETTGEGEFAFSE